MERAGDILKAFLSDADLQKGRRYDTFFRSWEGIAGEPLASHSRVLEIEGRTVVVQVDHPGWFQMLRFHQSRILERIQKGYPELGITAVRVRVEQGPGYGSAPGASGRAAPPEREPRRRDTRVPPPSMPSAAPTPPSVSEIEDPSLREALKRLHRNVIRHNRGKRSQG